MKKIYMYFHAGSKNHGCEAIVRSSIKYISEPVTVISATPAEDLEYHLDELVTLKERPSTQYSTIEKIQIVLSGNDEKKEKCGYHLRAKREAALIPPKAIALSIGGDNYCYGDAYNYYLDGMNRCLHKKGCRTVLWGCSIEPSTVTPEMEADFRNYDLITARESISYNFLRQYNPNTLLVCDSAFELDAEYSPLPPLFVEGKTIGVNLSPLIQKSESKEGISLENYDNMISYIIENTDYYIALIPHVVWEGNDDRVPMKALLDRYKESNRIFMIEDCNCEQLKGYISQCELFVGARTHATIAAYSTCVPTLAIGYSTKAKGIACDLFGTDEHFVLPVQSLEKNDDMTNAFIWLNSHKQEIREHLHDIMPEYVKKINVGIQALEQL